MQHLVSYFSAKLLAPLLVVFFVGSTVATGGLAVAKLRNSQSAPQPVQQVPVTPTLTPAQQSVQTVRTGLQAATGISPTPSKTVSAAQTAVRTSLPATPTPRPTAVAASQSGGCIIALWGKSYDVTSLQSTHPGGNVFQCGTDMTAIYQRQHGNDVSRMAQYLVSSGQTGTVSPAPTANIGRDAEDEDESQDERDRYEREIPKPKETHSESEDTEER